LNEFTQDRQAALATYYQTLMYHWMHQDLLMWGRMAFASAVEGSGVYAYWSLLGSHHHWIACALAVVVSLLLFETYLLVVLDQHDRNVNRDLMDALAKELTPRYISPARTSAERPPTNRYSRWSFQFAYALADTKRGASLTGGNLLTGSLLIVVILDLIGAKIATFCF
jgi:hypothetical protein